MIIFDLICEHEHRFEGWFRDAAAFDQQAQSRMICCPQCDSVTVRKLPSAVAITGKATAPVESAVSSTPSAPATPTQVLSLYKQLTAALHSMAEDVGTQFAEEARKMHYCESPERAIRGQASEEEYEALREEGVAVLRLPVIKDDDLN